MSKRKNKRRRKYWKRQEITPAVRISGELILRNAEKKRRRKQNTIICICCACMIFAVVWLLTNILVAMGVSLFLGAALLMGFVAYLSFSEVVSDYRIYRHGSRYAGTCTGTKWVGKLMLLQVDWSENDVQHSGLYSGFSKLCRFPYPVTVYYWKGTANLGLSTLLHDLVIFLLLLYVTIAFGVMAFGLLMSHIGLCA